MRWFLCLFLLLCPGLLLAAPLQIPYVPGTPVKIDASKVSDAYVTVTGVQPVKFAAPTGAGLALGQVLLIEIKSDSPVDVSWDPAWTARYGVPPPTKLAGGPVRILWGFRYDDADKTWGYMASTEIPPRLESCQIIMGSTEGAILTETSFLRPAICNVPGAVNVVEVVLSVDTGTPAVQPSKQSGAGVVEGLTQTPLQMPAGKTLVCARLVAEKGLAGVDCQAGLVKTLIPDGAWSLGVSGGKAQGATRTAVMTVYYAVSR